MINSLKNEADIGDKYRPRPTDVDRMHGMAKYDRHLVSQRLSKCASYQASSNLNSKTTELESYSRSESHSNHHYKYSNTSVSASHDPHSRENRYGQHMQLQSFSGTEHGMESTSNKSYELSHDNRFKNGFHSTPLAPSGPVRLPYIMGGESPI